LTSLGIALDNQLMIPSSTTPVVLVADDEPTMLELVARHLKSMDNPKLVVIEASDGEQAWRMAREHLPDLVVLDVMMPGMSGWEVCRKIREDVALAHTGVVMLTGIGENLNQMTSPLYGADAYVDKPFEFGELDEKVKGALDARASQREGISRPASNGVSGPAKSAAGKKLAKPGPKKAKPAARKVTQVSAKKKVATKTKAKKAKRPAAKKAKRPAAKKAKRPARKTKRVARKAGKKKR
jgi:DNA-binding response OmpR family regulator